MSFCIRDLVKFFFASYQYAYIQLVADQQDHNDDIQPDHECDQGTYGAIDFVIVQEIIYEKKEHCGSNADEHRRQNRTDGNKFEFVGK
jgi:hypothetical protein